MKKLMFALFAGTIVVLAGCLKNDNPTNSSCTPLTTAAPASEIASLKTYLDSNHIIATQDSRGFFYTIDSSASTTPGYPLRCSDVSVAYVGKLTNGTTFDSASAATPVSFNLTYVITGWQEAIPLMKKNATMNLYLPPSLAYGNKANGTIPANSNLIFNIKLLAFN